MKTKLSNPMTGLVIYIFTQLRKGAMSGYDLSKLVESNCAWKASHQQIYRELKCYREAGYLVCEVIPQDGKPDRIMYTLTESGIKSLDESIEAHEQNVFIRPAYDMTTVMLTLENMEYLENLRLELSYRISSLEKHMAEIENDLSKLPAEKRIQEEFNLMAHRREMNSYQAEFQSCSEMIEFIRDRNSTTAQAA